MANEPSDSELVDSAAALLNPRRVGDRFLGDVASVLVTRAGNQFGGVCIDTPSGTGFCAEHAAVAAMVTAGEYHITRIVAVWRGEDGAVYVLPPCGRCREFIRQIDSANLDAHVILGRGTGLRSGSSCPTPSGLIRTETHHRRRARCGGYWISTPRSHARGTAEPGW